MIAAEQLRLERVSLADVMTSDWQRETMLTPGRYM
jgi:hypothetical protein